MSGIFISFEGGDGSGKSTQINLLKEYMEKKGKEVVLSREPGGTEIGEKIRQIILDPENKEMADEAEALLYAASRAQHVAEKIMPALKEGKVVIIDRYIDSSIVYQGIGRMLGEDEVRLINEFGTKKLLPDVTIYLSLSAGEGLKRKKNQARLDRLEEAGESFHLSVEEGYEKICRENNSRFIVVNGLDTVENIHKSIISKLIDKKIL